MILLAMKQRKEAAESGTGKGWLGRPLNYLLVS
jgi:hypothetical protein